MTISTNHVSTTIVALLVIFALSSPADAEETPEQRRACTQDAFKFCSSEIPNVPRITECMTKNLKYLSPACRSQFNVGQTQRRARND